MNLRRHRLLPALPAAVLALAATPALAADGSEAVAVTAAAPEEPQAAADAVQPAPASAPAPAPAPAAPFAFTKPVFDETWVSIGLGAGLVPSYAGSNDYIAFPLPLIVGRVGGVGIRPNGPGLTFDVLSPKPAFGKRKTRLAFGPAFRIRNDRDAQIEDDVVETAGRLDLALEAGLNAAVSFPGVLRPLDTLTVGAQVRWDVLGAHEGMVIEPQVSYSTPLGKAFVLQVQTGLEFVDDNFADYYFSVTPAQRAASGLPAFTATGGLNRIGTFAILNYDLDGNALNGGWTVYGVGGYSRLLGDAADTPYTSLRGSPNQFISGLGVGYTF
jgi:MipA family protein